MKSAKNASKLSLRKMHVKESLPGEMPVEGSTGTVTNGTTMGPELILGNHPLVSEILCDTKQYRVATK